MLLVHLSNHEGTPQEAEECSMDHMAAHMKWSPGFSDQVVRHVTRDGLARRVNGTGLALTTKGREVAQQVMLR